jgi:hypothetical protein
MKKDAEAVQSPYAHSYGVGDGSHVSLFRLGEGPERFPGSSDETTVRGKQGTCLGALAAAAVEHHVPVFRNFVEPLFQFQKWYEFGDRNVGLGVFFGLSHVQKQAVGFAVLVASFIAEYRAWILIKPQFNII